MRIGVLGAICFDESISATGEVHTGFGGIVYNLAALASFADRGDAILPVSNVGRDRYADVIALLQTLPHVGLGALRPCDEPLTHVTLQWKDGNDRDEVILHSMPPVTMDQLDSMRPADAVHINFVNAHDVHLETLQAFRRRFQGLISLDIHQLVASIDETGHRTLRGVPEWQDWAACADVWQCNESELLALFPECPMGRDALAQAALRIGYHGPRAVCVTLGDRGALMVHRVDDRYYRVDASEPPAFPVVDPTGCGDSFSAGFLVGLLQRKRPVDAFALALTAAAMNAGRRGFGVLDGVKAHLADPRRSVPALAQHGKDWLGEPM